MVKQDLNIINLDLKINGTRVLNTRAWDKKTKEQTSSLNNIEHQGIDAILNTPFETIFINNRFC